MPIFEYTCEKCVETIELIRKLDDPPPNCSICGEATVKIMSACGWDLVGEGWFNPHNPMRSNRGGVPKPTKK